MNVNELNDNQIHVLKILFSRKNYHKSMNIAKFLNIPKSYVDFTLDQLEKMRFVISSPSKRMKKPHELVKEFATKRIPPIDLYKEVDKEFKLTQKGELAFLEYFKKTKEKEIKSDN